MNVLQRTIAHQLIGQRFAVERLRHLSLCSNIVLQQLPSTLSINSNCGGITTQQCRSYNVKTTSDAMDMNELNVKKAMSRGGIIYRLRNYFGLVPRERRLLVLQNHKLYYKLVQNIKYTEFFARFNLPNTFNSWFLVTELHVWMLMARGMGEGDGAEEDGRYIRNNLVKCMFHDIESRIIQLNQGMVRQRAAEYGNQFRYSIILYDEGLLSDDSVLANALWQRFFNSDCDNVEKLDMMVQYVRKTTYNLDVSDRDAWLDMAWLVPLKQLERFD